MFGKSEHHKKSYIIYHLRLSDVNKASEKVNDRLKLIYTVIQNHLLDEYIDDLLEKYNSMVNDFNKFDSISIESAFNAENNKLNKMYKEYKLFEEKEIELNNFIENELTYALRCKFGFNPLEDNELLAQAIKFENQTSSIVKNIIKSPAK